MSASASLPFCTENRAKDPMKKYGDYPMSLTTFFDYSMICMKKPGNIMSIKRQG
jgi:hypothetical protein